jgi:monofunctional biosynthetic peptidoglycan transglycosylase
MAKARRRAWLLPTIGQLRRLRNTCPQSTSFMLRRERRDHLPAGSYAIDWTNLADISPLLIGAVVEAEDSAFFRHHGLSLRGIRYAAQQLVTRREIVSGGSTISQQLARNLYLGPERTFRRKLFEAALALGLELFLKKRRIVELYLNCIEWGHGIWGCKQACRYYWQKLPKDVDAFESAVLAGIIAAPRHPLDSRNIERMTGKQLTVLRGMYMREIIDMPTYVKSVAASVAMYERVTSGQDMLSALRHHGHDGGGLNFCAAGLQVNHRR